MLDETVTAIMDALPLIARILLIVLSLLGLGAFLIWFFERRR